MRQQNSLLISLGILCKLDSKEVVLQTQTLKRTGRVW